MKNLFRKAFSMMLIFTVVFSCLPAVRATVTSEDLAAAEAALAAIQARIDEGVVGFYREHGTYELIMEMFDRENEIAGQTITDIGNPKDATSFENVLAALDLIAEGNTLRETDEHRQADHDGQPDRLAVSDYTMALAQAQTNYTAYVWGHWKGLKNAGYFYYSGENIAAATYASYDPFDGWYTKEKKYYDDYVSEHPGATPAEIAAGAAGQVGHYMNLVNPKKENNTRRCDLTGLGVSLYAENGYDYTYGQEFLRSSYPTGNEAGVKPIPTYGTTYSVEAYKAALQAYITGLDEELAAAQAEVDRIREELNGHQHVWGDPVWNWATDGSSATATFTCTEDSSHTVTLDALVSRDGTEPTCTEPGTVDCLATVSFNEASYFDTQTFTLPALGHDYHVSAWNWDYLLTSATADLVCSHDSSHTQTLSATVSEDWSGTTCEEGGTVVITATVSYDGQTFSDSRDLAVSEGHIWIFDGFSYSEDYSRAWCDFHCERDVTHTTKAEMSQYNYIVDSQPTCENSGHVRFSYSLSRLQSPNRINYGVSSNADLPALGHDYQFTGWDWQGDWTDAALVFTCSRDSDHIVRIDAEISSTVRDDGWTVYTATAEFEGVTYTDTKEIPPGHTHNYKLTGWNWSDDCSSATAVFTCAADSSHVLSVPSEVTSVPVDPTCTEPGKTVYTASVTFEGQTYSDEKTVITADATGHAYHVSEWDWDYLLTSATADLVCSHDSSHTLTLNAAISEDWSGTTCEEGGTVVVTATVSYDGQTFSDSRDLAVSEGHIWIFDGFSYSEDYSKAWCDFHCERDGTHTVKAEMRQNSYRIDPQPTCENDGIVFFSYSLSRLQSPNRINYSVSSSHVLPSIGHDWSEPVWSWAEDCTSAAATFVCRNDSSHTETIDAQIYHELLPGSQIRYTATVTLNGITYTDQKTVSVSPVEMEIRALDSTAGAFLSWDPVPGADRYMVYTTTSGKDSLLGSVTDASFDDSGDLVMGDTYTYRVVAVDANGDMLTEGICENFFNPFRDDLTDDDPRLTYIAWAYNNEIVKGTSTTTFDPDGSTTRMNFVMILYKMHGSPKVSGKNPFKDVSGSKSVKAVLWAYNKGLVKGTDATHFSPDVNLSRINIIMILWKLAGSPKVSGTNKFTDISGTKTINAVKWAVKKKIISGVDETHFDPEGQCSRALFVEVLYKYNAIYKIMK